MRSPVQEKRTKVSQLPDSEGTLADYVPDNAPLIEEVLSEKTELNQLFKRLQKLMPEVKRIGELREEGSSPPTHLPTVRSLGLLFL